MINNVCPFITSALLLPQRTTTQPDGNSETINNIEVVRTQCLGPDCKAWGVLTRNIHTDAVVLGCKLIPQDK